MTRGENNIKIEPLTKNPRRIGKYLLPLCHVSVRRKQTSAQSSSPARSVGIIACLSLCSVSSEFFCQDYWTSSVAHLHNQHPQMNVLFSSPIISCEAFSPHTFPLLFLEFSHWQSWISRCDLLGARMWKTKVSRSHLNLFYSLLPA